MLSSASTETATDLAPVKSASTPPTAPPEASTPSGSDVTVKTNKDTTSFF